MINESDWQRHLSLQKAIAWEQAKGALRTVVAIQGNTYYGGASKKAEYFSKIKKKVEVFIKQFEDEGYQE